MNHADHHTAAVLALVRKVRGLGASFALLVVSFAAAAAPSVDAILPVSAQVATVVRIDGSSLGDAQTVTFNGAPAEFRIEGNGRLYATVPVGATTGPVTVTSPSGAASSAADFVVLASPAVLVGAGDISDCVGKAEDTAKLLDVTPGTVFTTGDHAYSNATEAEFNNCYEPTWGRHKSRTRPVAGTVEYYTQGAAPYFNYFGPAAGEPGKGYYSYDVGDWHIVALNSRCAEVGGCTADSVQGRWLREDLLRHPKTCQLAYWASPRFSSGPHGSDAAFSDFWQILHNAGAEVVVSGHDHTYERFAPQNAGGLADPLGVRQFVAGTGGRNLYSITTVQPNSEIYNTSTHGVLKLTLNPASYDWRFLPIAGKTFTDSGSAACRQVNQVPLVESGPDQVVTWPASATLRGKALDDRQPDPPGTFSTGWSLVSGPGTASFSDSAAADTSVTFSQAGVYVLRLSGDDGTHLVTDDVRVVALGDGVQVLGTESRVSASSDDAEEFRKSGAVYLASADLELIADGTVDQVVGVRFGAVAVPPGAVIVNAYMQFQVDEPSIDPATLTVWGEAADQSPTFVATSGNVSARRPTAAAVTWVPAAWPTVGRAGVDQQTPDLRAIIQEIVDRPGWAEGNPLSVILGGSGRRTAEAFDGDAAPILRIQYVVPGTERPAADLAVSVSDTPDPVVLGQTVTYTTTLTNYGPLAATGVSATGTLATCSAGSLQPNSSVSCTAQVAASSMTLPSVKMTIAGNELDSSLGNNSATAATTVVAPDLQPMALAAGVVSGNIVVNDQVANVGTAAARTFSVRYFLSADAVYGSDTPLCTRSITGLDAGSLAPASGTTATSCAVPKVAPGSYYIIAVVDSGSAVRESNEKNNVMIGNSLSLTAPDLLPAALTGARANGSSAKVSISDTITNGGDIPAGALTIGYVISPDTTYEAGADLALATSAGGSSPCVRSLTSLKGSVSSTASKTCYKPAGAQNGVLYYILVVNDVTGTVIESDEFNNVRATANTIKW